MQDVEYVENDGRHLYYYLAKVSALLDCTKAGIKETWPFLRYS